MTVTYEEDNVFDENDDNVHFDVRAGKVTVTGDTPAAICGHRLLLSSEIGVQFKVVASAQTNVAGWYMDFSYSDGRAGVTQRIGEAEKASDTAYWFTAYINPLELADTITATLHCGDKTVTDTYSAMTYINTARTKLSDHENVIGVIDALQDYSHYLLATDWTDGRNHAAIKAASSSVSIEAARTGVAGMAVRNSLENTGVSETTFSLTLNSKTQIDVFAKLENGVTITAEKGSYTALSDGRYRFSTPKIGPMNLGSAWTIAIQTSRGTARVNVSAMSYVHAVLNDGGFTKAQQQAMAAYYFYYRAAAAF